MEAREREGKARESLSLTLSLSRTFELTLVAKSVAVLSVACEVRRDNATPVSVKMDVDEEGQPIDNDDVEIDASAALFENKKVRAVIRVRV